MKFSALPESLGVTVARALEISDAKGLKPVFGYVHLVARDGLIYVNALDDTCLFQGVSKPETFEVAGSAVIEAQNLGAVFKTVQAALPVSFSLQDGFLHISQGDFKVKLPHYVGEEFPEFNLQLTSPVPVVLDEVSVNALGRVSVCLEKEKSTNKFSGLLFDLAPNRVRLCGMNNRQVHVFTKRLDQPLAIQGRFCISKSAADVLRSQKAASLVAHVDLQSKAVLFEGKDTKLKVSWVADAYPRHYAALLGLDNPDGLVFCQPGPSPEPNVVVPGKVEPRWFCEFSLQEFLEAFQACSIVLGDSDVAVEYSMSEFADKDDVVIGRTSLIGFNHITHARAAKIAYCIAQARTKFRTGLHKEKALQSLKELGTTRFRFWFHSELAPILASEVHEADPGYQFVVALVPLRIG